MRALVTGADGFLGSHLVDLLLRWGKVDQVVALVHGPPVKWLPRVPEERLSVVRGDLIRPITLERVGHVNAVFHLAAVASVAQCDRRPEVARLTNFQGTVNLLNQAIAMRPMPVFVHVSTAAVYGEPTYLPVDEVHPVEARDHYTASKLSAEMTVMAYGQSQGLPVVVVRPFNIYGPRQLEDFLIPTIITQCLQGIELRLGDGRLVRNFTFVSDAVDLLARAALVKRAWGRVINLGSRQSYSVAQVADKVVDLTGCGLEPIYDPARYREGEPTVVEMDPRLAEELVGWYPRVWIDDGLRATIEHYRGVVEAETRRVREEMYGRYPVAPAPDLTGSGPGPAYRP